MPCKKCAKDPQDGLLEGFCVDCIYQIGADLKQLSREDLKRARALVESETSGLFASDLLMGILGELLENVDEGEDRTEALVHAANEIQRLGGLGMCREMIRMSEGIGQLGQEIEDEARRKIRVLSKMR